MSELRNSLENNAMDAGDAMDKIKENYAYFKIDPIRRIEIISIN